MACRIVSLLSDFGERDPYVAEMKAVILSISPKTRIVDISHQVDKFNVRMGAFILACAVPFFPAGTVHVAVVDPEVGTRRKPIIIETGHGFLVGPDNGLLALAAAKEGARNVYNITNMRYFRKPVSSTFHGRDIFAPVAAHLAEGENPCKFGPRIAEYFTPEFAEAKLEENVLSGKILHVDGFGNLVTNITASVAEKAGLKMGDAFAVQCAGKKRFAYFCSTYAEAKEKGLLAVIGSHGFLELSVYRGSAAEMLGTKTGNFQILL